MKQTEFNALADMMKPKVETQAKVIQSVSAVLTEGPVTRQDQVAANLTIGSITEQFRRYVDGINGTLQTLAGKYGLDYQPIEVSDYALE